MARVAIVTDSTADLPPEIARRAGITVVPLNVHFGDEVFRDGVDLTTGDFLRRLGSSDRLPTTSQPSAGLFTETYRRLATDHDAIVSVHISGKLSGTVGAATIARDDVASEVAVEVVDSATASMALGLLALRGAALAEEGLDGSAIAARLRAEAPGHHMVFFVDTLEYLRRGGRIGAARALLGSILDLKPILRVEDGVIVPLERTRTRVRARRSLVGFVRGLPTVARLAVLHNSTPDEARELADEFRLIVPRDEVLIAEMGPVIDTHVGPGAMGVAVAERMEP
ncbi:MAG: DegV family protein [uncultured Thermomicrobiales bacterium]|uniref:DegV family protein n=1 Tax=uncultured Thermomicrobiales bacterium TaxID=1645740 RepID=A0A6J4UTL8_9BACT|nr:MAG: DegV family protein [uncultured Thermomicrobiales bacterium]